VVISKQKIKEVSPNFVFVNSAKDALKVLEEMGFGKVLIAGGAMINTLFLKEDLIDEMYLDIEPFIFGNGIKLFQDGDFEKNLNLLEVKTLSKNTIQLYYEIK